MALGEAISGWEPTGEPDRTRDSTRTTSYEWRESAPMRDVAIVSFAQAPLDQPPGQSETQMLLPTITDALARVGMTRRDVGFTCSGSADYLTGGTFTFVQMLEAAGAWPPISESHVEMDGAWALYEAWVRLQHGDVDVALVYASGRAGLGVSLRETLTLQLDPYYLVPLGADYVSLAALQAQAVLARDRHAPNATSPRSSCGAARDASGNANAAVSGDFTVDDLLAEGLRRRAAARARHRPAGRRRGRGRARRRRPRRARCATGRRGSRASTTVPIRTTRACATSRRSPSTDARGETRGRRQGGVEVAELTGVCSPEELVLADALGPRRRRRDQPVGRRARRRTRRWSPASPASARRSAR